MTSITHEHFEVPRWLKWALGVFIVLRLIFISHDEIRVMPHDSQAYIFQARAWYWGNNYNNWAYTRQPGYPLFIAASSMLGVPLRLAIEGVWIAAVLIAVRATLRIGLRPVGGLLLAGLLLFHPFSTELFNWAMADTLYGCVWLAYTMALGMAIASRESRSMLRWGALAAVAGAVALNTRQEGVLVFALALAACAVAMGAWCVRRARGVSLSTLRDRLIAGVLLPIVVTFAAQQAIHAANYARIGAAVGYDWSLPGFKALYRTMLSIPPQDPRLRVPIPSDVRAKAAAASPIFAAMREEMERGAVCEPFRAAGSHTTGLADEPGSYNLWTMRESIWLVWGESIKSAADYDAICWRVVGELRSAQARGELGQRFAPMSFIPPEWGQLLVKVPMALPTCWRLMTRIEFTRGERYRVEPRVVRGFDEMALRRSALVRGPADQRADKGVWQHRGTVASLDGVKRALDRAWPVVSWMLLVSWLGGWCLALRACWLGRRGPSEAWWLLAGVCTISLAARVLLVALLDVTGVEASHRYMFPAAVLLVLAGILGIRGAVECLATRSQSKAGPINSV
jgi:hypothetical protein